MAGIKTINFDSVAKIDLHDQGFTRTLPRQLSTGSTRGTQNVGYGGVAIDGSNNRISVTVDQTQVLIGDINDTTDVQGFGVSDNDGTLRLLAGRFSDGAVQIALSQPGIDVSTANSDQMIWSSDFNMFKIVQTSTATITHSTELDKVTTVYHGLGYTPVAFAYIEINSGLPGVGITRLPLPYSVMDTSTGTITRQVSFYVTDNNLYIEEKAQTGFNVYSSTNIIRYYLMRETAG